MAWGTLRQHSTGATWEHSPVHDDRILGFIPPVLFGGGRSNSKNSKSTQKSSKTTGTFSKTAVSGISDDASNARRRPHKTMPQPQQHYPFPRGGQDAYFSPPPGPYAVFRPPQQQRRRPVTMDPPPSVAPRSLYDDPAFSADPTSHPHFASTDQERRSSRQQQRVVQPTPAKHISELHKREPALSHRSSTQPGRNSPNVDYEEAYGGLLVPPTPHSRNTNNISANSLLTSDYGTYSTPSSTNSHSSTDHSSTSHSSMSTPTSIPPPPKVRAMYGVVNRAPSPVQPPPPYEESPLVITQDMPEEENTQRPSAPRGISAPELHHTPSPPIHPPRPNTAPIPDVDIHLAVPLQRREPSNRSNSARARELDRIDELDETDPFGIGSHHRGPYEAITAILGGAPDNAAGMGAGVNSGLFPKKQRSKRVCTFTSESIEGSLNVYSYQPTQSVQFPGGLGYDPYAPLNLVPGQILPRAPLVDPRTLEQTPYHRQHHSVSTPAPPRPEIAMPRRGSERQPPHPRHFQADPAVPPSLQPRQPPPQSRLPNNQFNLFPPQQQSSPHIQFAPGSLPPPQSLSQLRSPPAPAQNRLHHPEPQEQSVQFAPDSLPQPQSLSQLRSPPPQGQPRLLQPEPQENMQIRPETLPQPQSFSDFRPPQPPTQHRVRPESQPNPPRPQYTPSQNQAPRMESWSPERAPSEYTTTSSRHTSHHGPVPLHVPRRLVMPTPLQNTQFELPNVHSHDQPHHAQQLQPHPHQLPLQQPFRAPPSQVQFHDPSLPAKANFQPRAADITMLPDGRKLLRKRTVTHPGNAPVPVHVALGDHPPPPNMSSKGLFAGYGLGQEQDPPMGYLAKTKEKSQRRLSKRRNDI